MLEKIKETVAFINKKVKIDSNIGIILGTGLGGLVSEINIIYELEYKDIPNFPVSTVYGHKGKLIYGELGGKKVIAMQGRFHYYEGYSMQEVVFPIRVLKLLGINYLLVSNAAGGVNPDFKVGDMMIINDHINLFATNPLIGKNIDELGPRFPDMLSIYNTSLREKALDICKENDFSVQQGVYAGVSGPTFETKAEYRYLNIIGADAVGMSTVPEIIAARHMNLTCFAISIISDMGVGENIVEVTHQEVIDIASEAEPKMTLLFKELINYID